jgi:hypothetical protein
MIVTTTATIVVAVIRQHATDTVVTDTAGVDTMVVMNIASMNTTFAVLPVIHIAHHKAPLTSTQSMLHVPHASLKNPHHLAISLCLHDRVEIQHVAVVEVEAGTVRAVRASSLPRLLPISEPS